MGGGSHQTLAAETVLLELPAVPIDSSDGTEMPLGDLLAGVAGDEATGDSRVR